MIKPTDCAIVLGQRGCGKSFLAKNWQSLWPRRIIIDSLNEYQSGELIVHNFNDFADTLSHYDEIKRDKFEIIYQFDFETRNREVIFEEILKLCYYFGNVLIVVEEIQLYSSPHNLPWRLENALMTGRHQNIALLFTSQRPGLVNKSIFSQCSHQFVGRITEGNDLKYLRNVLGSEADKLSQLPDRKFLYFSNEGVQEISNDF